MANRGRAHKTDPSAYAGQGFPVNFSMHRAGTLAAASTTELASFIVPLSYEPDRTGTVIRLTDVSLSFGTAGSTSGNTTVNIVKNGDTTNGILGTITIASSVTKKYFQIDLRDVYGKGLPLVSGDRVGVYVSAVTGTAPSDMQVNVSGEAYGEVG